MGGKKTEYSLELNHEHMDWLKKMQDNYGLFDADKALRIVMEYVMEEVDPAIVFEEIRCNHCGGTSNQD
jgi:hypothetical protein